MSLVVVLQLYTMKYRKWETQVCFTLWNRLHNVKDFMSSAHIQQNKLQNAVLFPLHLFSFIFYSLPLVILLFNYIKKLSLLITYVYIRVFGEINSISIQRWLKLASFIFNTEVMGSPLLFILVLVYTFFTWKKYTECLGNDKPISKESVIFEN